MKLLAQLIEALPYIIEGVSFFAIVSGVSKAFEWFDRMLNPSAKRAVSQSITNPPDDVSIQSISTVIPQLIDIGFGNRAFSIRFFLRSCLMSFIAETVFLYLFIQSGHVVIRLGYRSWLLMVPLLALLAVNFAPDYVSLLISRTIVRLMVKNSTAAKTYYLLLLDTLLTSSVATIGLLCVIRAASSLFTVDTFQSALATTLPGGDQARMEFDRYILVAYFCASFFSSLFVWLNALSSTVIRTLQKARFIWVRVTPYLDIDRKPLAAVGRVAGILAGMAYAGTLGAVWLFRHLQ